MKGSGHSCPPLASTQVFIQTGRRTYMYMVIYKTELFDSVGLLHRQVNPSNKTQCQIQTSHSETLMEMSGTFYFSLRIHIISMFSFQTTHEDLRRPCLLKAMSADCCTSISVCSCAVAYKVLVLGNVSFYFLRFSL